MTKITITIEGSTEELGPILGKLGELRDLRNLGREGAVEAGEGEWTRERVFAVWNDLSPNAKKVLGVFARNGEAGWDEQVRLTNLTGAQVGGSLSSLGAQLRNHSLRGITNPLFENEVGGYALLPVWKEIVLDNTGEH